MNLNPAVVTTLLTKSRKQTGFRACLEPLEPRIAPAAVFHYIDVDGDKVTVTTSKGTADDLTAASLLVAPATGAVPNGRYLQTLDFSSSPIFAGTDLTVSVVRVPGGDGLADLGYIDATAVDGGQDLPLGSISIRGDLGQIAAGAGSGTALKSLAVYSLGMLGLSTQGAGGGLGCEIKGSIGSLTITTDMGPGYVAARGGDLLSVKVGGSIHGGDTRSAGEIFAEGNLGPVTIGGDLIGGSGFFSGSIAANGKITSVAVNGSLLGGAGDSSGTITSGYTTAGDLGPVRILHDVIGGAGPGSGSLNSKTAGGSITSVTIGGSLIGAAGSNSGYISSHIDIGTGAGGKIGPVSIKGNVVGGTTSLSGCINAQGDLQSVTIGGSIIGGSGPYAGTVNTGGGITGRVSIGRSLIGGTNDSAGSIVAGTALHEVRIGGSVLGGAGTEAGSILCADATSITIGGDLRGDLGPSGGALKIRHGDVATTISIGGSVLGGGGESSGSLSTAGAFGAVAIDGDVRGGSELQSGSLHAATGLRSLFIGGSLVGGSSSMLATTFADGPGSVIIEAGTVSSVRVIDSVVGGSSDYSGVVAGTGKVTIGSIFIGGDCVGGSGVSSGGLVCGAGGLGGAGSITIIGSLVGGVVSETGFITGTDFQAIAIGGNFVGGSKLGNAGAVQNSGHIFSSGHIGRLTIGGSIVAGNSDVRGTLFDSARISAVQEIGPVVVKGSIIGNESALVVIQSGSQAAATPTKNLSLASLTVGGSVKHTLILASGSGQEQIGAVTVRHDWVASSLAAGIETGDGYYGNANDSTGVSSSIAKIASISIAGRLAGSAVAGEHYGFVSHEIGSFKLGGVNLKLTAGAANDVIELATENGNLTLREA